VGCDSRNQMLDRGLSMLRQGGLTIVELMVSIAIATTVMSGVVQVLVVSKSNFVTGRELSAMQENARFAVKYLGDEIRMGGFSGCSATPPEFANSINDSEDSWYLANLGLEGFDSDAGLGTFPDEFEDDVADNTDAIVVRRSEDTGLRISAAHVAASGSITLNTAHSLQPGQPVVVANTDCLQVGIFQSSGPANAGNTATTIEHGTGAGITGPGNCVINVRGSFTCDAPGGANLESFAIGSRVMLLRSEAYYIGESASDPTVPALFRERMFVNTTTSDIETISEELVQGVENMQILYGLDNAGDNGTADIYLQSDHADMDWDNVVTVRIMLRMRSVSPVYNENVAYDEFQGVDDTDGADRYMRQTVTTTIKIRNS